MAPPATKPDRRRTPRTNLAGLVYIHFERDNGGIVLNISEGGLCFHAVVPVEHGAKLPFSLSANGNFIEAVGLLAWTDEQRRTGGLRFSGLVPDARLQIRTLIEQSSGPFSHEQEWTAQLQGGQSPSGRLSNPALTAISAVSRALSRWVPAPFRWGDFSRGLAVGLLIALLVAAGYSLDGGRRQMAGFLIRLGERLEPTPQHEPPPNVASTPSPSAPGPPASASARSRAALLATGPAAPKPPVSTSSKSTQRHEHLQSQPAVKTQPRVRSNYSSASRAPAVTPTPAASLPLFSATPASASPPHAATNVSRSASVASQPTSSAPQPASPASPAVLSSESKVVAKAAGRPGGNENTEDVVEINSGVPLGRYFDVGKFKDEFTARQAELNLTDLGFRAVVLPQSFLWMKSYRVLVGPYRNAQDAEGARDSLRSRGYKPRSPPMRSRQLTLVIGEHTDNLIVTWEAYSAQGTVRFVKEGQTSGNAVGKWVKLPGPSAYSAIVYTIGDKGKRTLLSIQFEGMTQAVMLPDSAGGGIVF